MPSYKIRGSYSILIMKKAVFIIFIFITNYQFGQNFLGNPGFEEINKCEEYGASCAPEAWFRIPPYDLTVTDKADRKPNRGKISELVVIENIYNPLARRIFLYTKILCPLQEGKEYQLTFFLNNLKLKNYKLEVLFSEEELIAGVKNPLKFDANLVFTKSNVVGRGSKKGWKKMQATYVATGKENFLTLGNFSKKSIRVSRKEVSNLAGDVVILIDDIQLVPVDKEEKLCDDFEKERINVFDQNYRHTNKISINGKPVTMDGDRILWDKNFLEIPLDEKHEEKKDIPIAVEPVLPDRNWEEKDTLVFEIPNVAFDFDRTQIKGEFKDRLDTFALQITYLNPEKVQIIGHTDSMGSNRYNKKLSERRAKAVSEYLNQYDFFKSVAKEIIGKGENQPKATNKTVEGRQMNRRVEIVIFKNKNNYSSQ